MRKEIRLEYEEYKGIDALPEGDRTLFETALEAMQHAYAPYSKFAVGSAVKLKNGKIVLGSNQENIAYPSGLCAERVALFSAAANHPKVSIEAIAVAASPLSEDEELTVSPCGACRQVILEYERLSENPIRIITGSKKGKILVVKNSNALLPLAFFDSGL